VIGAVLAVAMGLGSEKPSFNFIAQFITTESFAFSKGDSYHDSIFRHSAFSGDFEGSYTFPKNWISIRGFIKKLMTSKIVT
jgi:hypothetical protein